MPLAYNALVPFAVLLIGAALTRLRALRARRGVVAAAATAVSCLIVLRLLLQLRPTERVDFVYLRAFPGAADLALRLDGLSLAFAAVLLATATGLLLARLRPQADRRDPWAGWLLTAAAALLVVMAGNLLLVYIAMQVLTLAWSGALDEGAPRARSLRLAHQAGDVALLVAAASAIRSSGTSAFAGMPSDAIGPLVLILLLIPVVIRAASVVLAPLPPQGTIAFVPAVAWVAPGAALLFRVLSLAAGRPVDRPVQVAVFSLALLAAAGLSVAAAATESWPRFAAAMLTAQAAVAVALGILQNPLATVGAAWVSLQLILLTGLVSLQLRKGTPAQSLTTLALGLFPPGAAFLGIWVALAASSGGRLLATGLPLGLVAVLATLAVFRHLAWPRLDLRWPDDAWAGLFLALALVPAPFTWGLVLPVARTVRAIPAGAFSADWFGFAVGGAHWPVTLAGIAGTAVAAGLLRLRSPAWSGWNVRLALPWLPERVRQWELAVPNLPWVTLGWMVYAVVLVEMVQR